MNQEQFDDLWRTGLRRPLTPEEEEALRLFLAAGEAEEELLLQRELRELRAPAVSSNFVALTLAAAADCRPGKSPFRFLTPPSWIASPRRWAYACAGAALLGAAALTGYFEHAESLRKERAKSLAAITIAGVAPTVEMLKDFDAINQLSQAPPNNADLDRLLGDLQ